jgi:methyltransferase (TIGR00027 family)
MEPGRPSATAFRVAMRRAAHQVLDSPRVLEDPVALRIIGPARAESLRTDRRTYDSRFARRLRAFLVARSRCAEDALAEAVTRGVTQYVILGAGLDTFAYRNPFPAGTLRVFEVDHPATQAWKLELLRKTGIAIPDGVTFVPVDFASQSLRERLSGSGFAAAAPAFYSWLGVTMYLEREAVLSTLGWIAANTPRGGGIVFDYAISPATLNWFERWVYRGMARRVAAVGEPWRATFVPAELVRALRELGVADVEDLRAREINARYFAERRDKLQVGTLAGLISARI